MTKPKLAFVSSLVVTALAAVIMLAVPSQAGVVLPTGLVPGSQYQLVFVTSGSTTATSTNMDDYNSFVTQQAALSSSLPAGVTWTAIGSTQTVHAMDNAVTYANVPIYNTGGQLVASDSASLWSGAIDSPIIYNQDGLLAPAAQPVWTGSSSDGTPLGPLGEFYLLPAPPYLPGSYTSPTVGVTSETSWQWVSSGYFYGPLANVSAETFPLYAISSPITVVPEPATLVLLGSAVLGLAGVLHLRRRSAWRGRP